MNTLKLFNLVLFLLIGLRTNWIHAQNQGLPCATYVNSGSLRHGILIVSINSEDSSLVHVCYSMGSISFIIQGNYSLKGDTIFSEDFVNCLIRGNRLFMLSKDNIVLGRSKGFILADEKKIHKIQKLYQKRLLSYGYYFNGNCLLVK
ncbi:MAG: hypothetical protein U0T82_14530 [Bacteroidales bacterium]